MALKTRLGDTCAPFAKLGASLNLPSTAVLSLQAPDQYVAITPDVPYQRRAGLTSRLPLMDGPSCSWYNTFDRMFNPIPHPDPTKHVPMLRKLLETLTSSEIGWDLHRIHLFGWGQGGSMALELAKSVTVKPLGDTVKRLGSVISICGPLLPTASSVSTPGQTPALLFTRLPPQAAAHRRQKGDLQAVCKELEVINGEKGRGGEDMPRGRVEWEGIMKFWGNVLAKDEGWKGKGEVYEVVR